jgi:hypothetical protein
MVCFVLPARVSQQLPFRAFSWVMDCDTLDIPVNVPFMWTGDRDNEVIPESTPIAHEWLIFAIGLNGN